MAKSDKIKTLYFGEDFDFDEVTLQAATRMFLARIPGALTANGGVNRSFVARKAIESAATGLTLFNHSTIAALDRVGRVMAEAGGYDVVDEHGHIDYGKVIEVLAEAAVPEGSEE